jgi:hypothetical protein
MNLIPSLSIGLICSLVMAGPQAADVAVFGSWSEQLGAIDLAAGAGSDIRSPITSDGSQTYISIANTGGGAWTLYVRRTDSSLPSGVSLAMRRISSGSGTGTIVGGEGDLTVTDMDQEFFFGSGDRIDIALQLRLDGVSVRHGMGTFGTLIHYRID